MSDTITIEAKTEPDRAPVVVAKDGVVFADSRDVARVFEKRHPDVVRAIRSLGCSAAFMERNFAFREEIQPHSTGAAKTVFFDMTRARATRPRRGSNVPLGRFLFTSLRRATPQAAGNSAFCSPGRSPAVPFPTKRGGRRAFRPARTNGGSPARFVFPPRGGTLHNRSRRP